MKNLSFFYKSIIFFFSGAFLFSCKEFIEPSIAKKTVQINAPSDQYQSKSFNVSFWWGSVEDALSYRLQIVSPSFENTGELVVDTLVKGNKFAITLDPGNYQWHVRAENGSSQTNYTDARSLTIEPSTITSQAITLSSPANNSVTSQSSIVFKWNSLYGATKYQVEIDTNNFTDENELILNQVTPGLQLNYSLSKAQTYEWRVRAMNETEQSNWSSINYVTYTIPPPVQVSLISPTNAVTINSPVQLSWNNIDNIRSYKLYLFKNDSTSLYSTDYPRIVNANSFNFNSANTGETIYWKVSAINSSGTEGKASFIRKFTTIQ